MMTTLDSKTLQLLEKVRKGATASFSATKYAAVLEATGFTVEAFRKDGSKAYTITAPNGDTFEWAKQPRHRCLVDYDLRPWAVKHGLVERACELLGKPSVEEERARKAAAKKTSEARFTCPICFGEYKTVESTGSNQHGRLVRHGYKRPGYGYIEGGCYGEHEVPFEVSCDATQTFLNDVVRPALSRAQKELSEAQAATVVPRRKGETISKGERLFEVYHRDHVRPYERRLRQIEQDAAFYEKKVASWTLKARSTKSTLTAKVGPAWELI